MIPTPRRGNALIALSAVFFATMAVLVRTLAGRVPAAQVVVFRHLVGLSVIGAYFLFRGRGPTLARPRLLLLRGVFGGAAVLSYFVAIERLGAAPATILNYASPIYATFWAALLLKERPSRMSLVGLVCATVGAILVASSTHPTASWTSLGGALAGIASGVFGGAAITAVKAARSNADAPTVFGAFSLVGLLMGLLPAVSTWTTVDAPTLLVLLLVGFLALVGQLLFTQGLAYTTATSGSATTQLVPVLSWALAVLFLKEPIQPLAAGGALFSVGGVLLGIVPRK